MIDNYICIYIYDLIDNILENHISFHNIYIFFFSLAANSKTFNFANIFITLFVTYKWRRWNSENMAIQWKDWTNSDRWF